MATVREKQAAGVLVTLVMILGGAVTVDSMEDTFYCQDLDMVLECAKLSSTGRTCYWETGRKLCPGTWDPVGDSLPPEEIPWDESILISDSDWICPTTDGRIDLDVECKLGDTHLPFRKVILSDELWGAMNE